MRSSDIGHTGDTVTFSVSGGWRHFGLLLLGFKKEQERVMSTIKSAMCIYTHSSGRVSLSFFFDIVPST